MPKKGGCSKNEPIRSAQAACGWLKAAVFRGSLEYPQNVATWLDYTIKVTTSVAGSEGTVQRSLATRFIEGDESNGSFLDSPYGVETGSKACELPG